jgi:hypothetical protein
MNEKEVLERRWGGLLARTVEAGAGARLGWFVRANSTERLRHTPESGANAFGASWLTSVERRTGTARAGAPARIARSRDASGAMVASASRLCERSTAPDARRGSRLVSRKSVLRWGWWWFCVRMRSGRPMELAFRPGMSFQLRDTHSQIGCATKPTEVAFEPGISLALGDTQPGWLCHKTRSGDV